MAETTNGKAQIADVAKNTDEIRAYPPKVLKQLVKAIAGLKNGGRDWTISDITTEALVDWLKKPENLELIQHHNLQNLLDELDQILNK
ncbi:MAG: hypothetical protein KME13_24070 [Myxacorys californica WJT36-NPBG1]|jgi:hypothetical protein|nr:hypothetical protein [Myxacorys californica WJT36-NPBG1]